MRPIGTFINICSSRNLESIGYLQTSVDFWTTVLAVFTARRYASAVYAVSLCLSVRLSVLLPNG